MVKPRAAFYIFPKMDVKKFNITDDEQFALDLLHEKKILITRGGGFNWAEPDHFRIVYLPRMEVLKESLEDLADFFDHYRQSSLVPPFYRMAARSLSCAQPASLPWLSK